MKTAREVMEHLIDQACQWKIYYGTPKPVGYFIQQLSAKDRKLLEGMTAEQIMDLVCTNNSYLQIYKKPDPAKKESKRKKVYKLGST